MKTRALGLALWLAGCGSTPNPPSEELVETVGAAGATLRGDVGSQLEGVELIIPAGALAAPTEVRIVPVVDDTPLPLLAERVGNQFAIEPADLALAAPATLTLPVASQLVQQLSQSPADVKVWIRDGAGWSLQMPSATSDDTVTISLSTFTTAAAGVRLAISGPSCTAAACKLLTCPSSTGFCSQSLGIPASPPRTSNFVTDGKAAYYTVATSSAGTAIARLDLSSAALTYSTTLPLASLGKGLGLDSDGSVWLGLDGHLGNAHFPFGGAVTRYDFDGTKSGNGAFLTAAGTLIRFASGMAAPRVGGPTAPFGAFHSEGASATTDLSPGTDDYFIALAGGQLLRVGSAKGDSLGILPWMGPTVQGAIKIVASTDGTTTVPPTLAQMTYTGGALGLGYAKKGAAALQPVSLPFILVDIDMDSTGGVWIAGNTAEIHYLTPDLGLNSAPLTTATDPTTPAYVQALPRQVRALSNTACVVLLESGEFRVIRRTP
jgi:hypothetical protein